MFDIRCKPLTPERMKAVAANEVAVIGRPFRIVLAAGGAYLFYYGTKPDVPAGTENAAVVFGIVGIAAALLAIFSQKLIAMAYFAKALRSGRFPLSVSFGAGGVFVRRRDGSGKYRTGEKEKTDELGRQKAGTGDIASAGAERFFSYAEIGNIAEHDEYFYVSLKNYSAPGIFIYKKDFGHGEPEAFISFVASKKAAL